MSTTRGFAYNTGSPIGGTTQVGNLAIGTDNTLDFSQQPGGVTWREGPDETVGYVIAAPNPSGNPTEVGIPAFLGFWRTTLKKQTIMKLFHQQMNWSTIYLSNKLFILKEKNVKSIYHNTCCI
jgi:hypothetical protein